MSSIFKPNHMYQVYNPYWWGVAQTEAEVESSSFLTAMPVPDTEFVHQTICQSDCFLVVSIKRMTKGEPYYKLQVVGRLCGWMKLHELWMAPGANWFEEIKDNNV